MSTSKSTTALFLLLVTATAACSTSAADRATQAPDAFRDGEYQRLAVLVGDWNGTGTMEMGGKTAAMKSELSCQPASGGVAVTCVHKADVEGRGPLVETSLIGIDPNDGRLHWFNINNMGDTHDHVGRWANDEVLEWTFEGDHGGQRLVENITVKISDNALSMRSECTVGGERAALFTGTLRKRGG